MDGDDPMQQPSLPFAEIIGIVGADHALSAPEDLLCYGYDASKLKAAPQAVAFPGSVEEVAALLKLANRYRFPVFPRGPEAASWVQPFPGAAVWSWRLPV